MSATDVAKRAVTGPTTVGRYVLHREIAAGGMATVYLGRMAGPAGFARVVAIKRMHDIYAADPELVSMFIDEAALAARIQHPNVAATLDVVAKQKEIFIVMDYVHGESLAALLRTARKRRDQIPVGVASSILCGVLAGLHAAHTARGESGELLAIVHRDVSPQNILVGPEGLARVVDFGVAKAASRVHDSGNADGRGKLGYTAPERLASPPVCDARADIFSTAVIAWEMLAGRRLFTGVDEKSLLADVLGGPIPDFSQTRKDVSPELWSVLEKGLSRSHDARWESAEAFGRALEDAAPVATARNVGAWVMSLARDSIGQREQYMRDMETAARVKRTGSYGDAMSVNQLVEEIEAKSGELKLTTRPPPPLARMQSEPSIRSGELPSTSGVRVGLAPSPSPPPGSAAAPDAGAGSFDVPEAVVTPTRSRIPLIAGAAVAAVLLIVAIVALGGSDPAKTADTGAPSVTPTAAEPPVPSTADRVPYDPALDPALADPAPAASSAAAEPPLLPSAPASASAAASATASPATAPPAWSGRPVTTRPPGVPPGPRPGYIPDAP